MEQLVFKNRSDKMFDPGPEGLLVPMPDGFEGAREIEGSAPVDVRAGQGVAVKSPIPPNAGALFASQIRIGFVIPAEGEPSVEFRQKMPLGIERPLLLVPVTARLTVEATGLRALPEQADKQGNAVKLYELEDIAPGGTLAFTVRGLPALEHRGRHIAAAICLLMLAGAVVFAARGRQSAHLEAGTDKLAERREKLFAELVALEQARRQAKSDKSDGKRDGSLEQRRQDLVSKLESVYRELANVAHGERALP
jgi:hypothetical protein